jgi:hypothetical protein
VEEKYDLGRGAEGFGVEGEETGDPGEEDTGPEEEQGLE